MAAWDSLRRRSEFVKIPTMVSPRNKAILVAPRTRCACVSARRDQNVAAARAIVKNKKTTAIPTGWAKSDRPPANVAVMTTSPAAIMITASPAARKLACRKA